MCPFGINQRGEFGSGDYPVGVGFAVSKLGLLADAMGEYQHAIRYHEGALHEFEEFDDLVGAAYTISRLSPASYGLFVFVVNQPAAVHHVLGRAKSGMDYLEARLPAEVTEAAQERVKNWEIEAVAAGLRKKSLSIDPG